MKKGTILFIQGIASVLDICPASVRLLRPRPTYTPPDRDIINWRKDWEKVGTDLNHAITLLSNEQK